MAGRITLILGVIKIVAGLIIIGLAGANYHYHSGNVEEINAHLFGPILAGIFIVIAGVFGILADRSAGKWDVMYLIGATIATCCGAGVLWHSATAYSRTCQKIGTLFVSGCDDTTEGILIALIVFGLVAFVVGFAGMVMTGLRACNSRKV